MGILRTVMVNLVAMSAINVVEGTCTLTSKHSKPSTKSISYRSKVWT